MDLALRNARRSDDLAKAQETLIASKRMDFPNRLETGKWHDVRVTVVDDELTCAINGEIVGSFRSEGFAHPTKRLLRLLVPNNAHVDDVMIWRQK